MAGLSTATVAKGTTGVIERPAVGVYFLGVYKVPGLAFWLISNFRRRVEGFEVVGAPGGGTDPLEYSFDAFGKRRNTNWTPDHSDALQTATLWNHRGYTDHEQLDNVRLIHLGGRVYDPKLGRFLSADPVLGDLGDPQSLNPYSYVANNPLAYTDPSGFTDETVVADKGYDSDALVDFIRQRHARAVIPPRRNRLHRRRCVPGSQSDRALFLPSQAI